MHQLENLLCFAPLGKDIYWYHLAMQYYLLLTLPFFFKFYLKNRFKKISYQCENLCLKISVCKNTVSTIKPTANVFYKQQPKIALRYLAYPKHSLCTSLALKCRNFLYVLLETNQLRPFKPDRQHKKKDIWKHKQASPIELKTNCQERLTLLNLSDL